MLVFLKLRNYLLTEINISSVQVMNYERCGMGEGVYGEYWCSEGDRGWVGLLHIAITVAKQR